MAASREHFIPLSRHDLVALLASSLPPQQAERLAKLTTILSALFHYESHQRLEQLEKAYAHFDPDRDTVARTSLDQAERERMLTGLFEDFIALMERANFKHLCQEQLQLALAQSSDWGINMDVDWSCFERVDIFVRGDVLGKRTRRRLTNFYRPEEVEVPIYQRLVLILKQRPHPRLGPHADTANVFLKIFKDIPKVDLEMLLPGTRVLMPHFEKGKLGLSLASTVGFVAYKLATTMSLLALPALTANPLALWGPVSLVAGYGYRQYAGFQQTKREYSFKLTKSLYYQSLDSNAGVLFRLLHEAEAQECREALLAYYFLWQDPSGNGCTEAKLDAKIESYLERATGLAVDFEVDDALAKLIRLGIASRDGSIYRALPIDETLRRLEQAWDGLFDYATMPESLAA